MPWNKLWEILVDPDYGVEFKLARAMIRMHENCEEFITLPYADDIALIAKIPVAL